MHPVHSVTLNMAVQDHAPAPASPRLGRSQPYSVRYAERLLVDYEQPPPLAVSGQRRCWLAVDGVCTVSTLPEFAKDTLLPGARHPVRLTEPSLF